MDPLCCGRESDPEIPPEKKKKEKNTKNVTLIEFIFEEQGGMIDPVILTRQKKTISFPNSG